MLYGKKFIYLTLPIIFSFSCASIPKKGISLRESIILMAERLIGAPYKYGGADIYGFDCSGFIYYVFSKDGVLLPRSTDKLIQTGRTVSFRRASKGDLMFFRLEKEGLHVGIYAGKGTFIHASKMGVKKEILNRYWKKRLIKIKRVI